MSKVAMLEAGIKGLANAIERFAIADKNFAEHGIRSDLLPKQ